MHETTAFNSCFTSGDVFFPSIGVCHRQETGGSVSLPLQMTFQVVCQVILPLQLVTLQLFGVNAQYSFSAGVTLVRIFYGHYLVYRKMLCFLSYLILCKSESRFEERIALSDGKIIKKLTSNFIIKIVIYFFLTLNASHES